MLSNQLEQRSATLHLEIWWGEQDDLVRKGARGEFAFLFFPLLSPPAWTESPRPLTDQLDLLLLSHSPQIKLTRHSRKSPSIPLNLRRVIKLILVHLLPSLQSPIETTMISSRTEKESSIFFRAWFAMSRQTMRSGDAGTTREPRSRWRNELRNHRRPRRRGTEFASTQIET